MIDPTIIKRAVATLEELPGHRRSLELITDVTLLDGEIRLRIDFLEGKATLSDNDQIATYEIVADNSGNVSSFQVVSRSTRAARFTTVNG
ncbi:MAG: gas vesicle protein GvpO [Pseudomonadota bacterium]